MNIGRVLKVARVRCGLKQIDAAKSSGMATALLERWENGDNAFAMFERMAKLARVYNVSLDDLAEMCIPREDAAPKYSQRTFEEVLHV